MRRDTCSACGSDDLRAFLDLGESPIADAYTNGPDDPSPTYPLEVAVCGKCHLAQLLEVIDADILFGTGYSFHTSASPPLSAYHRRYADHILAEYGDLARRFTVEVGCNDGDLLRHLDAAGCRTLGVDPAAGPVDVARDRGLVVHQRALTAEFAGAVRDQSGPAGLVVANHVLAHVADVSDLIAGVETLMADDGLAMVEVQYLPDLLVNNAFDLVYHEHRNFFSLTSLERAAARWGLHVVGAQLTDRQGGSLRVTLARRPRYRGEVESLRLSERWLSDMCAYEGMQGRAERIRTKLWQLLADGQRAGRSIAGYGAPAKATTLLNWCKIDNTVLTHVVDTTPAKQGRHIPGTGLRIVAPDRAPAADTLVALAWNYLPTLLRQERGHLERGGKWIVPIPAPVIL